MAELHSPENLERLKAQGFQKGNPYRFHKGRKPTLEDREKISKALKGKPLTEEHKERIRQASLAHPERKRTMLGKHHTDKTRFKMSIMVKRMASARRGVIVWERYEGYDKDLEELYRKSKVISVIKG
jgi:hypothetical protein